jgi:NAD(P)-dependent dehydrogenase (short-subunit alcohol dehydrogenase family)
MRETNRTLGWLAAGVGAAVAVRAAVRWQRRIDLRGRSVLVTGGSRGLGLVLAREFARRGARVAVCARDGDELDRARDDLRRRGADVLAVSCDLTDRRQVFELVRRVRDHYGQVDVLVNNAGVIQVGPAELMTLEDYEEAMRTHFWAPLYTTLAVLPDMRRRREGRIVNVSSIGGIVSVPHLVPYNASKFALRGLSEGLRAELLKDGIYLTTVCPGLMRTGSPPNAFFKGQHQLEYAWFSIGDALPLLTISAEHAARQIVRACVYGKSEVLLTLPAQVAARFHGLCPGLTADLLGLVNQVLPGPGGIGTARVRGRESTSALSPSWATTLSDRASLRNNELPASDGNGRR